MRLDYDPTTDSLYIHLAERPSAESDEVAEGVVLDTSILLNVIKIDQLPLLGQIGAPVVMLDRAAAAAGLAPLSDRRPDRQPDPGRSARARRGRRPVDRMGGQAPVQIAPYHIP